MTGGKVTGAGTLTLNGDVTATSASGPNPARIAGTGRGSLSLQGFGFDVRPGPGARDLIISTPISGLGLSKFGAGTLRLTGNGPNSFWGSTVVLAGVLELAKTNGAQAVSGTLFIGSGLGAVNTAVVRLLAANQLPNNAKVEVARDGLLDLNNHDDTIGPLTLHSGSVATGTGSLTLNGNVTATSTALGAATVTGQLNLGTAARTFTVNDGSFAEDLVVQGSISAPSGLIKEGAGKLVVRGPNSSAVAATI